MKAQYENARAITERIVIEGLLELASPARFGAPDADATSSAPLLRGVDGRPYFPGSTVKGLLRGLSHGPRPEDLFGDAFGQVRTGDPKPRQARLLMDDGKIVGTNVAATEIRDGVAIDPALGIAMSRKKYDGEWLCAGTIFRLRLELLLEGDPERDRNRKESLLWILGAIEAGRLAVGARTSRGFGATKLAGATGCRWTMTRHRIADRGDPGATGLWAWLGEGVAGLPADWPSAEAKAFPDTCTLAKSWECALPRGQSDNRSVHIDLDLHVQGSLIIRGPGDAPGSAEKESDAEHLRRRRVAGAEEIIVPGTSLAGVLRHRCRRILRSLLPSARWKEADQVIDELFGAVPTGARSRSRASRVRVSETVVTRGRLLRHTRLRIDPFTGGAKESLLFTEDALFGGKLLPRIELRPGAREDEQADKVGRAVLLLAIRDLGIGDLHVGGESGAGRGRLGPAGTSGAFAHVRFDGKKAEMAFQNDQVTITPHDAFAGDFEELAAWMEGT